MPISVDNDRSVWDVEAILRKILNQLPDDCDKIVWLDSDVYFTNLHWVKQVSYLLKYYIAAQPFSVIDRGDNGTSINSLAFSIHQAGKSVLQHTPQQGFPGKAWAFRRKMLDKDGLRFHLPLCEKVSWASWAEKIWENAEGSISFVPGGVTTLKN
ncbi:hypothetical protein CCP3SC15_5830001 [Gammaproteobacteria bacterium]